MSDFISKYLREPGEVKKAKIGLFDGHCGEKEVFSSKDSDLFSEDTSRFRENPVGGFMDSPEENISKVEVKSQVSDAKRKFIDEIEDDSLTVDVCDKVRR